jgi:hypothetical protein
MKTRAHLAATIIAGVIASALFSAEPAATVAGEYADKSFLQGKGVFQLSLEQNGKDVSIFFSAHTTTGMALRPKPMERARLPLKARLNLNGKIISKTWEPEQSNAPVTM